MPPFDEAYDETGAPRAHYAGALPADPAAAAAATARRARAAGIATSRGPLPVDPVPRVLTAAEWTYLERGLTQRAARLDALVAAVYAGEPPPLPSLESCVYLEPDLVGTPGHLGIVGFDVIRLPDGRFAVLEDNVLTPGHTAVPAARELAGPAPAGVRPVAAATTELLRGMLGPGRAAILGDDPPSWELRRLGSDLRLPTVTTDDDLARFDVLWQRTAEDRLTDGRGSLTHLGRALREPLREGTLRVVSRIGCGVADDKRVFAHVDPEPAIPIVPTLDLADPAQRERVLREPDRYVVKPRFGAGGRGVCTGDGIRRDQLEREPLNWVAQELVELSVHPTVGADGRLEPRRVDLRLFAVRDHGSGTWALLPGGVSRHAPSRDDLLVNTSAGGGIKDVWVLAD